MIPSSQLPRFSEPSREPAAEVSRWERYGQLGDQRDAIWRQIGALVQQHGLHYGEAVAEQIDELERRSDELWREMCAIDDASFEDDL